MDTMEWHGVNGMKAMIKGKERSKFVISVMEGRALVGIIEPFYEDS
jgi:hypothetical protein